MQFQDVYVVIFQFVCASIIMIGWAVLFYLAYAVFSSDSRSASKKFKYEDELTQQYALNKKAAEKKAAEKKAAEKKAAEKKASATVHKFTGTR